MCSTAVAFCAPGWTQLNQKGLMGVSFFLIFIILDMHFRSLQNITGIIDSNGVINIINPVVEILKSIYRIKYESIFG